MEPYIETTEYIMFSIDPATFQRDFINTDPISLFEIRTSFNPATELLIVKMISPEHGEIGMSVNKAIDLAIQRMGLGLAIHNYPGVDINVDGKKKQPDMGWGPIRPPRGCEKRPTVVLEVAVSETGIGEMKITGTRS